MDNRMLKTLRVLLVDDDRGFLDAMALFFKRVFKEVYLTDSPTEALTLLQEKTPHIVITDIHMPKMDGHELAKEVHRLRPHTPVFFLSALEESKRSKELADGYIKKELFNQGELEKTLSVISKRTLDVIGKCSECIYMIDLEEYNFVQCELNGDLMPKGQLYLQHPISEPCPFLDMVGSGEKKGKSPSL